MTINGQRGAEALLDTAAPGASGPKVMSISWTRWWILVVFTTLSITQAYTWNFYGPIASQIIAAEGWTLNQIAWVENAANIAMLLSIPFSACFVQLRGMRRPTITCAVLMVVCTAMRCIRWPVHTGFVMALISMTCNGAAAAWLNFAGPVLSTTWFAASERGFATAIVSVAPFIGQSIGFIVGPLVIPSQQGTAEGIRRLGIGECVVSISILLALVVRFPDRPPIAPSTASEHMWSGTGASSVEQAGQIAVWRRLAFVVLLASVPTGVFGGWVPVLTPNLAEFDVSEEEASWVGCFTTLLGATGGLIFGRVADICPGKLKELLVLCLVASTVFFSVFALVVMGRLRGGATALCFSGGLGGFFVNAVTPLGFELAMETAYPRVPETFAAASISFVNTVVQIGFLAMAFLAPASQSGASSVWMNSLNVFANLVLVIPLVLFEPRYPRLSADGIALSIGNAEFDSRGRGSEGIRTRT